MSGGSHIFEVLVRHVLVRAMNSQWRSDEYISEADGGEGEQMARTIAMMRNWGVADDSPSSPVRSDDDAPTTHDADCGDGVSPPPPSTLGVEAAPTDDAPSPGSDRTLLSRRRLYTNEFKLMVVNQAKLGGSRTDLAARFSVKSRTSINAWLKHEQELINACNQKKKSKSCVGGQGRPPIFPFTDVVVQWVKDMRRENFPLKTSHVVKFIKEEYEEWSEDYVARNKEDSLYRLVRRLLRRCGFSFRTATRSLLSADELHELQRQYVIEVCDPLSRVYSRSCVFNADETGVYYDDDHGRVINEKGSKKCARVKGRQRSNRVTVLLTISATGVKLRPLIIFGATAGGTVQDEFYYLPKGACYAVQKNAWMDARVWHDHYVNGIWDDYVADEFPDPVALFVDNLECHVSEKSVEDFACHGVEVVPLPKNSTCVIQPLDVGVMGPFKKKLRALAFDNDFALLSVRRDLPLRERLAALHQRSAKEKRLAIAHRIIKAWSLISEETVRRAWEKAGI